MSRKKVKDLKMDIRQKELEIKELRDKIRELELQRDYVVRKLLRLEKKLMR